MPRGVYDRSKAKPRSKKAASGKTASKRKAKSLRPVTGRLRASANTPPKIREQLDRAFMRARGYEVRTSKHIVVNHDKQSCILANDEIWIIHSVGVEPSERGATIVRVVIDSMNDLYVYDTDGDGQRTHLVFASGADEGYFYEEQEPLNKWEFVGRVDLAQLRVIEAVYDYKDKMRSLS